MKQFIVLLLLIVQHYSFAQQPFSKEKPPVFTECESVAIDALQQCFDQSVFDHIYNNFKVPERVYKEDYKGEVVVLFEVDTLGAFRVIYIDAFYEELKEETIRVFSEFPRVKPATHNSRNTFKQYSFPIQIPLVNQKVTSQDLAKVNKISALEAKAKREFDSVTARTIRFDKPNYKSQLNIPFVHSQYAKFDKEMNLVGTNSHTGAKPFIYSEVAKYYDFNAENEKLLQDRKTWVGRKLWNEHFVELQTANYWFTIDPVFDLQVGKDTDADFSYTYNNTRGLVVQGGFGDKFSFYTSFLESQGRFADYFNRYAETLKGFGPDPAIIPGRGIAKRYKTDAYDYPVAEAYLSYTPSNYFNFQFGHGKNFIGDGYRSLVLSDVASPHPFFKINTTFWKMKYTNTWMWLTDVRPEVVEDKAFKRKYIGNHFLSWNVSKRLNVGLFESVVWDNSNNRGFDINYLNPIIFYRAVEFETGQGAGNALMGATAKYKWNDNINIYGQFILDEFSLGDITGGEKSYKNKYGYQLGIKYYDAFKVDNLLLQFEYNRVRPYTYSHNTIVLNYAHSSQSMAHLWNSNFSEAIIIGRYHYNRWFANAKLIFGVRGFDFDDGVDDFSYGGDIYRDYFDRPFDTGVEIGQGIKTNIFNGNFQAGYLLNAASNMKIFGDVTFRDFDPNATTSTTYKNNTVWFTFGVRSDLFNWYFDF
ncbi:gliding motility protein RemB [Tamlana agarivorans]|uniref:Gliding motility protein RemB n=1 Tax=Pseudotamlana agarivorans TaxID=481183 RepID=A0ACC5U877_9FLAO|nr:gliding motility protein RemB [Tamlana agarivorans]MBU2950514.1 gliding motility protein RemB [Tamlana agarivorans]